MAQTKRSLGKNLGLETSFLGQCVGGSKGTRKCRAGRKKTDIFILENAWQTIVTYTLNGYDGAESKVDEEDQQALSMLMIPVELAPSDSRQPYPI